MKTTIAKEPEPKHCIFGKVICDDKICTETSMVFRPGDYCRENLKRKAL
jgi:hypothetical protein